MKHRLLPLVLVAGCGAALADPAPLVIDKTVPGMVKPRYIENVHLEIKTRTTDLDAIRSAILAAMSVAKGGPWSVADDGDGFVLARMQYEGNSMTLRIEFDRQFVQLKYHDASERYACEIVVGDGICYKNYRDYYGFAQNLRGSIIRELKRR